MAEECGDLTFGVPVSFFFLHLQALLASFPEGL